MSLESGRNIYNEQVFNIRRNFCMAESDLTLITSVNKEAPLYLAVAMHL